MVHVMGINLHTIRKYKYQRRRFLKEERNNKIYASANLVRIRKKELS